MKLKEEKVRRILREEIQRVLEQREDAVANDPWRRVMDIIADGERNYPDVLDIGQKEVGGETVHEFTVNDILFTVIKGTNE